MSGGASVAAEHSVRRRPEVLWRRAGDTAVLLAPEAAEPVVVAGSGAALWTALADAVTDADLVQSLAVSFGADPEELSPDVARALADMVVLGLVERV